jgi:hypothetical protein
LGNLRQAVQDLIRTAAVLQTNQGPPTEERPNDTFRVTIHQDGEERSGNPIHPSAPTNNDDDDDEADAFSDCARFTKQSILLLTLTTHI